MFYDVYDDSDYPFSDVYITSSRLKADRDQKSEFGNSDLFGR